MLLKPSMVELLAPVGTWDVLVAAIEAGADAVYLGGKRFNMRMHRTDVNFDDTMLEKAIQYAHERNVKLYITVNNLISDRELPAMRSYLQLLNRLQPDALIVQDVAIIELIREMKLSLTLHASVMMNTHNEYAIRMLQDYGITRVVVNREMTLSQLALLKERTGIEVEYFVHGDMCIAHSGQCLHSGILFGQSSNRGRCLKPCRWPYQLIDTTTGSPVSNNDPGPYKLALKDMCMYRNLPELIQAGVCSFKIEGRMRTADFVKKIVSVYRRAIDRYIADPVGYTVNESDWLDLYNHRSRDFSTCYALGNPGSSSVDYTGKREPRFFSQAVKEAGLSAPVSILPNNANKLWQTSSAAQPTLAVRVADLAGLTAACENGADYVYIGGEAFKPSTPWTLKQFTEAIAKAKKFGTQIVITTPRVTMERECGEYEQFFAAIDSAGPQGLMVGNMGMLYLAKQYSQLPLQTDFSFNVFNHQSLQWLQANGVKKATISLEATHEQIHQLLSHNTLPLELIVHGPLEAMILDHSIPAAATNQNLNHCDNQSNDQQYALLDTAGQYHPIVIDQYGRNHLLFAKDLCLLPFLSDLGRALNYRIEGQYYTPDLIGLLTRVYRAEIDKLSTAPSDYHFDASLLEKIAAISPRELGIGAFRYRISR